MNQWSHPAPGGGGSSIGGWLIASPIRFEWWLLAVAAVAIVLAFVVGQQSRVQLTFEARSSTPGSLQIYHASDGAYSELQTHIWPLQGGIVQDVSLTLPTRDTRMLRLDPLPGMSEIELCNMQIQLSDGRVLPVPTSQFRASGEAAVRGDGPCVVLTAPVSAGDPQVGVDLAPLAPELEREQRTGNSAATGWTALALVCLVACGVLSRFGSRSAALESGLARLGAGLPWVYLATALVFGTALALLTPPGAVPDEPAHVAKVVLVENGHWLGADNVRTTNPSLSSLLGPFGDFLNPGRRFSSESVFAHASTPLDCRPTNEAIPTSAANYSPTLYLPAAFALNVACRTGATVGSFVYGGRLANLLVAILLTFVGLRAAGTLRWPVFVVALFPMTLFEQASMTADSLALGMSFCLIGIQCGLASGSLRPRRSVEMALLLLGIGLAFSKPGYAWVCIGFLFSFAAYRQTPRRFAANVVALVLFPWVVHALWIMYTAEGTVPRAGVDPSSNLAAVFGRPDETLRLWARTFLGPGREFLWSSMVGRLGWLDVVLHPGSYALAGVAVLGSLMMRDRSGAIASTWVRPSAAVLAVGAATLPVIPMYLYWTPPSALLIEGLQGRYFLPAVAFALAWVSFRGPLPVRALGGPLILAAMFLINVDAIYSLAARYYG